MKWFGAPVFRNGEKLIAICFGAKQGRDFTCRSIRTFFKETLIHLLPYNEYEYLYQAWGVKNKEQVCHFNFMCFE